MSFTGFPFTVSLPLPSVIGRCFKQVLNVFLSPTLVVVDDVVVIFCCKTGALAQCMLARQLSDIFFHVHFDKHQILEVCLIELCPAEVYRCLQRNALNICGFWWSLTKWKDFEAEPPQLGQPEVGGLVNQPSGKKNWSG